ncbi:MAG: 2-succinyl-6-hydroxy-2,4-cyclohexadiene-1-carboxylate synthase [Chlamydiae bacterium]|nr:2-succinyl-6-hydroxy-2,4-cyclohexadiene-1-carboxylate synthase [Chlamydiota bacterium]
MILFLHGFLGQKEDWDPLLSYLPFPTKAIDLPGHGKSPMALDIALAVKEQVPSAPFVVGYSAGGRIALELKMRFPKDYGELILLSAHPGLTNKQERKKRMEQDQQWIEMLAREPFDHFLEKWYDQKLFQSFKKSGQFSALLKRRKQQNPAHLAQFLMQYSIARKKPSEVPPDAILIHGEEDLKYERVYRKLTRVNKVYPIKNAGHAVHLENPKACAEVIDEHYRKR